MRIFFFAIVLISLSSCDTDIGRFNSPVGYKPVYADVSNLGAYEILASRPIEEPGKIYAFGSYIYQNELNEGIHIVDNSTPGAPVKQAFMKIPYNTEMAIRGHYLYANKLTELLVFDISDPVNPTLVKTIEDVFPAVNQSYPPFVNVYFECADPSKGIVVKWEETTGVTYNCRR